MARRALVSLVCLCVVVLGYLYLSTQMSGSSAEKVDYYVQLNCPLHLKPCDMQLPGNKLRIALSPEGLPALEPITLSVLSKSGTSLATSIVAWFEGKDMDMGRHYFTESRSDDAESQWHAKGMIPVCSVDTQMVWALVLRMQMDEGLIELRINLDEAH